MMPWRRKLICKWTLLRHSLLFDTALRIAIHVATATVDNFSSALATDLACQGSLVVIEKY